MWLFKSLSQLNGVRVRFNLEIGKHVLMRVDEKKVHSCLFVLSLATCFSTISANDMSTLDQRETGSKQDPISQGSSEHGRDQRHHRHHHRHHRRHQSDPDQHKHRHRRSHREHRHFSSSSSNKLSKADDPFPQRDAWMLSAGNGGQGAFPPVSYTHLRAHET